jgi:hypothetical protein
MTSKNMAHGNNLPSLYCRSIIAIQFDMVVVSCDEVIYAETRFNRWRFRPVTSVRIDNWYFLGQERFVSVNNSTENNENKKYSFDTIFPA